MSALSLNPSYRWQGNDGNWSTFALRIGTPPQLVNVLPSTSGSSIWVVDPLGCQAAFDECPTLRGQLFNVNDSSSFRNKATDDTHPYFGLFDPEAPFGYDATAKVGLDIVALGNEGNVTGLLENQLVAAYADTFPWMGHLGLQVQNETVVDENDHTQSLLGSLNSTNIVSSAYWAYTAGAPWMDVYASLTFGGYDRERGDIGSAAKLQLLCDSPNLVVEITNISIATSPSPTTVGGQLPIRAFIDSVVPEIWLPQTACGAFEEAFNLTWNEDLEMYLVDDTLHEILLAADHAVTFTLSSDTTDTGIDIRLPYSAFDLTATFPLAGILNTTGTQRYFPLKHAQNAEQYCLGRTFLQGAHVSKACSPSSCANANKIRYLAVDYERKEFSVTQALYPFGDSRQIVKVERPSLDDSNLSTGAIVGIAVGAAALLALVGGLLFFCWRRNKNQKRKSKASSSIGGTTIEGWAEGVTSHEFVVPKYEDGEMEDQFKPELDANSTVRAHTGFYHRHELSAGSVRRTSQQSAFSRGTDVSPMGEPRSTSRTGHRSISSFGQPSPGSPGASPREMSAMLSPVSGQSSPPLLFSGQTMPTFELHGDSTAVPVEGSSPEVGSRLSDPADFLISRRPLHGDYSDGPYMPAENTSPEVPLSDEQATEGNARRVYEIRNP